MGTHCQIQVPASCQQHSSTVKYAGAPLTFCGSVQFGFQRFLKNCSSARRLVPRKVKLSVGRYYKRIMTISPSHIYGYGQFLIFNEPNMHVLGMWEEAAQVRVLDTNCTNDSWSLVLNPQTRILWLMCQPVVQIATLENH